MESGCRPPGGPTAGSARRALRLHRCSQARESVPGQRLPLLPAGGRAAQRVMSAALGAGPGAATATRGSAYHVRRADGAADWWSRGEGRVHGKGDAHGRGAAVRVLTRPTLDSGPGVRARCRLSGSQSSGEEARPSGLRVSGKSDQNLPELTSSHCLGCVWPRLPHRGHPENPANHRCPGRTRGAARPGLSLPS